MSSPAVSIVLPAYNREALLPRALDSIIAQTFDDWQIVLVDDGSTDGTHHVAARYADRLGDRFVYIRQANGGSSSARNRGIDESCGRFVAFLDSDDEFLPAKLERQVSLLELRPELGFVYGDCAFVDFNGVRHDSVFDTPCGLARKVPHEVVAPRLCVCTGDLFDALIRGYFIPTIVGMVRREVLGDSIRFPVGQAYAEEWLFYLKVARACRAGFVNESLCLHHHTAGSLARTDKHRNTLRYRNLLEAMLNAFGDLSRDHRRVVGRHLAQTYRQLGYDAHHAGRFGEALARFGVAFRYGPDVRMLHHMLESAMRCLCPGGANGRVGRRRSQDLLLSRSSPAAQPGGDPVPKGHFRIAPRFRGSGRRLAGRGSRRPAGTQAATGSRAKPAVPNTNRDGAERGPEPAIMSPNLPIMDTSGTRSRRRDGVDWERVWRHHPSVAKDDALLSRERRGRRWARILDRLEATFGLLEGLEAVELGSGRGDLSVLLAERGLRVTLLDANCKALDQARWRFERLGLNACYVQGDMLTSPAALCGRFDVALSSGVIEHFKGADRAQAARAHFDALTSGGVAIISVPHAWCVPYRLWKSYLEVRGWWPYGLEIPYTRGELTRLAGNVGFARVETEILGFPRWGGDHWVCHSSGRNENRADQTSFFDRVMGVTLLMFAWRDHTTHDSTGEEG